MFAVLRRTTTRWFRSRSTTTEAARFESWTILTLQQQQRSFTTIPATRKSSVTGSISSNWRPTTLSVLISTTGRRQLSSLSTTTALSSWPTPYYSSSSKKERTHFPPYNQTTVRYMRDANKNRGSTSSSSSSSSSSKTKGSRRNTGGFKLDALPFSISPEEALHNFRKWAEDDQGLRYLLSYNSVRIGAAYVPVWSFDLNIKFAGSNNSWKPPMFGIYGNQSATIYLPGLSSYAGYSYRRSLIHPVHSTTLVFMGEKTQPFGSWMLKDMQLQDTGAPISVVPDAWNATEGRSFQVVKEELQDLVNESWPFTEQEVPTVQTEVMAARRVYMPTFVIDYKILGLEYRAFISGCDQAAPVSGVSHQIMGSNNMFDNPEFHQASRDFLSTAVNTSLRLPRLLPVLLGLIRPILTAAWFIFVRLWAKIPIVGAAVGLLAGYRKVAQPYWDHRSASAEWERQRDHESQASEADDAWKFQKADFHDPDGRAAKFYFRHRSQILRSLSGDEDHTQGQYDWYKEWEQWAQQQWAQQQKAQQQQYGQWQKQQQQTWQQQQQTSQQRQQQQQTKSKPKTDYHWDFDENDPYSVLNIPHSATQKEISQAFRTQMLKHHPDTQPNASPAQKERNVERSKIISEAYRKLKKKNKK